MTKSTHLPAVSISLCACSARVVLVAVILMISDALMVPLLAESPYPFLPGSTREWRITDLPLNENDQVELTLQNGGQMIAQGSSINMGGLDITVNPSGHLRVSADSDVALRSAELTIAIRKAVGAKEQLGPKEQHGKDNSIGDTQPITRTVTLCRGQRNRGVTYYADFGDDLIRMCMSDSGVYAPVTRERMDDYFRRVQGQGLSRLIVWLSPFPYVAAPENYDPADWTLYEQQSAAILQSELLTKALSARQGFTSWGWLRFLMALRLRQDFGQMIGQSAADHGISLTLSYRPFEAALTKYYEVPCFDESGRYLNSFLPLASPVINRHPSEVGWVHYRELLHELNATDTATLHSIELPGVTNPEQYAGSEGIVICASRYPPQADSSLVLVKESDDRYELHPFSSLRAKADEQRMVITGTQVEAHGSSLRITGLNVPRDMRYLWLTWNGEGSGPDIAALEPVILRARAGNRLGRETTYWVTDAGDDPSRVAGVTSTGEFWSEFQACEAAQKNAAAGPSRKTLAGQTLIIDLGDSATVEMIDFNQPKARANALKEISFIMMQPGFDGLILNTRSHVDLPPSLADGDAGVLPAGRYWHSGGGLRWHLGLDKAYIPRSPEILSLLKPLTKNVVDVERITMWQPEEWRDECDTPDRLPFRYARNLGTSTGVRALIHDLERVFSDQRIQVVMPPQAAAIRRIQERLDAMRGSDGAIYGRRYYDRLWPSNNHIPSAGEGMSMVDLTGLRTEPVFLGSGGYLPDQQPLTFYVEECLKDLATNRGSTFRGPRTWFFEGQTTLRAADPVTAERRREEMIQYLLSRSGEINEVILYEAADWLYFRPSCDPGP